MSGLPTSSFLAAHSAILWFAIFIAGFVAFMLPLWRFLRPAKASEEKLTTYECGENPAGPAWIRDNDCKKGIALIEEAIQIFQKAGNKPRQGFALLDLQYIKRIVGDNETALVMAKEALEQFRSCGDRYGIARSLFWIGTSYVYREEYGEARSFFEEALEEFEVFGDKFYIAVTKENLGEIYRGLYEYEKAEACYGECPALRQEIGEAPINFSLEYMNLGYTALSRGDDKLAVSFFKERITLPKKGSAPTGPIRVTIR